jgi:CheY-like chemotaxis protein/anti-sigma regulatory factor (Ser/Thr protein kinase)
MSNHRVLVVDDEPLNLEIVAEFLEGLGLDLDLESCPELAWRRLQQPGCAYSLVILDRMMPGLDGIELLRRIKAEPRLRTMPAIMQTAAVAPDQIAEGIAAGAFYYLTKPYAADALVGVVRSALESVEMARTLRDVAMRESQYARLLRRAEMACVDLDDVHACTGMLAALCPDPALAAIGIKELLVNAVEHGNLGITYAEKKALRLADGWEAEIARRAALPENRGKVVLIRLVCEPGRIVFSIVDEGQGFDWRNYLDLDPRRAFDPNGRGIAMARSLSFESMEYNERGNEVRVTIRN